MQVVLNDQGKYTLVAESERDNTLLFSIVNGVTTQGVTFTFPQLKSKKGWSVRDLFSRKTRDEAVSVAMATEAMNRIQQAIKLEPEPAPEPKKGRGQYDRSKAKPRVKRARYTKTCPVIGCDKKTKGVQMHMMTAHGVRADGTVQDTFLHATAGVKPVKSPVVKLLDGTYKVRTERGLLD